MEGFAERALLGSEGAGVVREGEGDAPAKVASSLKRRDGEGGEVREVRENGEGFDDTRKLSSCDQAMKPG